MAITFRAQIVSLKNKNNQLSSDAADSWTAKTNCPEQYCFVYLEIGSGRFLITNADSMKVKRLGWDTLSFKDQVVDTKNLSTKSRMSAKA